MCGGLSTLGSNNITITLPFDLTTLQIMVLIDLGNDPEFDPQPNQLIGSIPSSYGTFSVLTKVSQNIWTCWGKNLKYCRLGSVSTITSVQEIYAFDSTHFFPDVSYTSPPSRVQLILSGSALTGTMPQSLGNLANLRFLNLQKNHLEGTILQDLANLTKMERLNLAGNDLVGTIPVELGNLSRIITFYLQDNKLTGSFPQFLCELPSLYFAKLEGNNITGSATCLCDPLTDPGQIVTVDTTQVDCPCC